MGKNQENKEGFLNDKEEVVMKSDGPIDWVCITECFCSDDGNPLRCKRWLPGDAVFISKRPSKHFVSRQEYNTGAGGREEYLVKLQQFGGIITDQIRNQPLHVLKALCIEQERTYLRRRAQAN